ncbi:DUF3574 domain-containing protein [Streptomyces buecherae]|uniref:DUF3574 domain-containing protein n=1 Tax=Streptomyces buecherae TaxID=2763006 RepID=A0A7H8N1M6_9ACTN|nr:DUF3574 domain-containing protein [Streptomyces buecherae]QKW48407.1 DUF3574 domain-containing protein [Streptomyces buecherae]
MSITTSRLRLAALASAAVLALGAPVAYATRDDGSAAPATGAATAHRGAAYVETRLFFGTARADGGAPVTDRQFRAFVDRRITPRFPAGLTLQEGHGQWRDRHGTIQRERSYELILLYPRARASAQDGPIEDIRTAYEREFEQESVARADEATWVDF